MNRSKQIKIDVKGIVEFFGGKHSIVSDHERILKSVITIKAIEKWMERETIPMKALLNLQSIAKTKNLDFKFEDFTK